MLVRGKILVEKDVTSDGDSFLKCKLEGFGGNIYYLNVFKQNTYVENDNIYNDVEKLNGKYVIIECARVDKWIIKNIEGIKEDEDALMKIDIEQYKGYLREHLNSFETKAYKQFVNNLFKRVDVSSKFFKSPASDSRGYSYEGGLLEHVVNLCNLIDSQIPYLSRTLKNTNVELLKLLAFVHQIGCVNAYDVVDNSISRTLELECYGEEHLTGIIISEELAKAKGLTEEEKMIIQHTCISSDTVYGKSKLAKVPETMLFTSYNYQDYLIADLKMLKHNRLNEEDFMKLNGSNIYTRSL